MARPHTSLTELLHCTASTRPALRRRPLPNRMLKKSAPFWYPCSRLLKLFLGGGFGRGQSPPLCSVVDEGPPRRRSRGVGTVSDRQGREPRPEDLQGAGSERLRDAQRAGGWRVVRYPIHG